MFKMAATAVIGQSDTWTVKDTHLHTLQRFGLASCKDTQTNKYLVARRQTREVVITADTSNTIQK